MSGTFRWTVYFPRLGHRHAETHERDTDSEPEQLFGVSHEKIVKVLLKRTSSIQCGLMLVQPRNLCHHQSLGVSNDQMVSHSFVLIDTLLNAIPFS